MSDEITRRDFLNGVQLTIAASLAPSQLIQAAAAQGAGPYPPALTGLRGSDDRSFAVLHGIAREGQSFPVDAAIASETYDLVVVGAGLAGLTAAWAYASKRPKARILILDNHDDFGGHARRCEFDVNGRQLIGYGGSESMVSPRTKFKGPLKKVLSGIGIEPERFYKESVFHRTLYPKLGLSRGIFFDAETFGRDALVPGDPLLLGFDEFAPGNPNARAWPAFLAACPLSEAGRAGLSRLVLEQKDYLAGTSAEDKLARLEQMSYRSFLLDTCALPLEAAHFFQGRSHDNFGLGIDAIPARDAMAGGFPGAKGLGVAGKLAEEHDDEPYVHHFPDGNATIARALVRAMIPGVAPAGSLDRLVTAKFDYGALDKAANRVRLRLNSPAIRVRNQGKAVDVAYVHNGTVHRISARHAIVAAFASVVPHICPEISEQARPIWSFNVRSPLLYVKVVVRNWKSFAALGVHKIAAPMAFATTVKLDYPVSMGSYKFPRRPDEPMALQVVHVPVEQNKGHDARTQSRLGRQWLLETPYAVIESKLRADLQRMLGPGGFDAGRDIAAITVNRWSHGYSYAPNSLFDDVAQVETWKTVMRAKVGNIAFASSDTAWDAYAHSAMDEALRAVNQLT